MNLFVLEKHKNFPYQQESHEIRQIWVHECLKWNKDLALPKEFIERCAQFSKYAEYVHSKAKEEAKESGKLMIESLWPGLHNCITLKIIGAGSA